MIELVIGMIMTFVLGLVVGIVAGWLIAMVKAIEYFDTEKERNGRT